ncbi:MAG: hypothetical protein V8Q79_07935 [Christensenellales bacterium]
MTLHEEQERVQKAVNHSLSHVQEDSMAHAAGSCTRERRRTYGQKVSLAFILILLVLSVITITALAAGILFSLSLSYQDSVASSGVLARLARPIQPESTRLSFMANLTENPEQTQSENSLVDVSVQDVSWTPEAEKLTISFKVSPKNPAQYELHSMWALDTDGAYIGEGGSTTATDDSEDRAMHWLWRSPDTDGYTGSLRYGPPMQMMDDSTKKLLLIDRKEITLFDGTLDVSGSSDMLRTPEGDIIFIEEVDLDWLNEEFDQKMKEWSEQYPDMKDYAEERIHAAQAIRAKLKDEIIPCRLTYSAVEYTEGMDDTQLYTGGEQGFVDFVLRPASGVNAAANQ